MDLTSHSFLTSYIGAGLLAVIERFVLYLKEDRGCRYFYKGDFQYPGFLVENKGGFVLGDFGYPRYWSEIKGGVEKKDEKLKKKVTK